jgi:branched-chain amino acid transport system substrate-binding protein
MSPDARHHATAQGQRTVGSTVARMLDYSRRLRRVVSLVGVPFVMVAVAVGCSDSKTVHTAKIGVIAPLDGGLVKFGRGIRNSVQLAVDEANRRNALPGWRFQVDAMDDSSDPAKGEAAARRLAADPAVVGVVGTYNSGVAAKVAPVLGGAGIVMISPGNTDTALTVGSDPTNPVRPNGNYFRVVAPDAVQAPFLSQAAMADAGAHRVAVVTQTKPVSKGLADTFAADFTAAGGTVAYTRVVPDSTTDFKDVVAELAPLTPDLVFFGGEYEVGAAFAKQVSDAGISAPVMGGDGIKDDAFVAKAGPASDGDLASTVGAPLSSLPSARPYVDAYTAANFLDPPSDFGVFAFDAANIVIGATAKALKGAGSVTAPARAAIVADVQQTDMAGASGRLAFDQWGDTRTKLLTLYRVTNGAWTAIKTETVA